MTIKIWNAFASNNSGSYVIVGSFPSEALAAEVAAELLEVACAESAWLEKEEGPSPLDLLADKIGAPREERGDAWPEHSNSAHPDVFAIGHQVFVHSDYTVTMPRLLGHAMYARGGRVQTELNHAHRAIIALELVRQHRAHALPQRAEFPAAWRGVVAGEPPFGEADLVIAVAFQDLPAGFLAVQAAAKAQGAGVRVLVAEAVGDPMAHLRPCAPPTVHALVDVWLEEIGLAPTNLTKVVARERHIGYGPARALIDSAPVVLLEGLTLERARAVLVELSVGNAVVRLRASPASRVLVVEEGD